MSDLNINRDVRDSEIRQAVEARRADDTKLMQKVNAANREAFVQRFPGQLEHCLRLLSERLQYCLSKPEGMDLQNPDTWPASPEELSQLSTAIAQLETVRQHWPHTEAK